MPALEHPSAADLQAFAVGALSEDAARAVESHLSDCAACLAVAAAAPDDTLVTLLRTAETSHAGPVTPGPAFAETIGLSRSESVPDPVAGPPELAGHTRYRIIRPLGRGGMGQVWLAEHTVMGRPVALKLIRPEFLDKPDAVERFRREVRAAARLKHPNIVAAHDADQAGGLHFLVMEYIEGETLAERIQAGPVPVADACRWVIDAAHGLDHARENGLIHRDVKPHNLILERATGRVKVLDFGLAGVATGESSGLTGGNVVIGTPDYIAPEQAEDARTADTRSDVYALGCTLYHLLAGRPPFPGDAILKKLDAHRLHVPEPVSAIRQDMSPALAELVARMLAKDPADRPQTPAEVAVALEAILAGRGGEPPVPLRRRWGGGGRWRRRWRRVAVGALVLFGVLGAVMYKMTDRADINVSNEAPDQVKWVIKKDGYVVSEPSRALLTSLFLPAGGEYTVELDRPDEFVAFPKSFAVRRGEMLTIRIVRVTREPQLAAVGPAAPADDGWTDLLPLVDPSRHTEVGRAARDDQGSRPGLVVNSTDDQHARVRLPFRPEGDYEVRATITRTEGQDALVLVLPLPDGPWMSSGGTAGIGFPVAGAIDMRPNVALHVDYNISFDGGWSGLRVVSPEHPGGPMSRLFGGRLEPGKGYPLYARVRVTGDTIAVRAELAGKVLVDWTGPVQAVSGGPWWSAEDNSRLAIGVLNGAFRVERLQARHLPGTGPTTLPGPATLRGQPNGPWTDLLPIVDQSLDREAGILRKYYEGPKAIAVIGPGVGRVARVAVPARPEGGYEVRTRITRLTGTDSFNLMLPVPGTAGRTQIGIRVDTVVKGDVVAGLDWPGGFSLPLTKTLEDRLQPGRPYDLVARVTGDAKRVQVRVEVNRKVVLEWAGPPTEVRDATVAFTNDRAFVGFGATVSEFRVEGFGLRMLSGSAPIGRSAPTPAPRAPVGPRELAGAADAPWTELIPGVNIPSHRLDEHGRWGFQGGTQTTSLLAGDARENGSRLALPVWPKGDYELRLKFARTAGDDGLVVMLPIPGTPGTQTALIVEGRTAQGAFVGIEHVDKKPFGAHEKSTERRLSNGTVYTLLVRVRANDGKASIRAEVEGGNERDDVRFEWGPGEVARLSPSSRWFTPDAAQLGLGVGDQTELRIDSVEFRPLTGTATWKPGPVRKSAE
jgi:hypothetical protein